MYRNGALETELVSGNNPFLRRQKLNPSAEVEKRFDGEIQKASNWRTPGWRAIPTIVRLFTAAAPLSACVRIMNSW